MKWVSVIHVQNVNHLLKSGQLNGTIFKGNENNVTLILIKKSSFLEHLEETWCCFAFIALDHTSCGKYF